MTALIGILEYPIEQNGYSMYSLQAVHYVSEIIWTLIPNQDIMRDYGLLEKVRTRLESDLLNIVENRTIMNQKNGSWEKLEYEKYVDFTSFQLKIVASPFYRKISNRA